MPEPHQAVCLAGTNGSEQQPDSSACPANALSAAERLNLDRYMNGAGCYVDG